MLVRLKRILKKPPSYILVRIWQEFTMMTERYRFLSRTKRLSSYYLAQTYGHNSVDEWWEHLTLRPYPSNLDFKVSDYHQICPSDSLRILSQADKACDHIVDFLGTGPTKLGKDIDWHLDFKSGYRWKPGYHKDLKYGNPKAFSDVKIPWELSRLQWLIPIGQGYLLTKNNMYALKARNILESWIDENPYGLSINWSCTMEVALRIISLTWLFHVFKNSSDWKSDEFKGKLLRTIYFHADFTSRHLERSDINGNHFTANAAGLVFAGLFFGPGNDSSNWQKLGWKILCDEFTNQVSDDGVDFEGSIAYHRLVMELFLYPALYMNKFNIPLPESYSTRLLMMARFTSAYSRNDGSVPLVGDADDARVLPFGEQNINDHRYLLAAVGTLLNNTELLQKFSGPLSEFFWLFETYSVQNYLKQTYEKQINNSTLFPDGGYIILRNERDHIFINANNLGLGGRGGHSHNDLLSFELSILDVQLVTDCGAFLYTSDYKERNNFRSTAYHNTPQIDKNEINRFFGKNYLWMLHNDAIPKIQEFYTSNEIDRVVASHSGYNRLDSPVSVERKFIMSHHRHKFTIEDTFRGSGKHFIETPIHLARDVNILSREKDSIIVSKQDKKFCISWNNYFDWDFEISKGRVSPSYGITYPISCCVWSRKGKLMPLKISIEPYQNKLD